MYPTYSGYQYVKATAPVAPPLAAPAPAPPSGHHFQQPQAGMAPPPSPSMESEKSKDDEALSYPTPDPISRMEDGKVWTLEVVQQPQRARMCGFGDKDRRPISPPPCVKLTIRDATTQQEIEYSNIDLTHFVLTVDIFHYKGHEEVNLVKHSNNSPSISSVTTTAYPPTVVAALPSQYQPPVYDVSGLSRYGPQSYASPGPTPPPSASSYYSSSDHSMYSATTYARSNSYPHSEGRYSVSGPSNGYPLVHPHAAMPPAELRSPYAAGSQSGNGTYTRNLIGSICASAFKLRDPSGKLGIWFILQDLSVRTEGYFRLKMSFVNIGKVQLPEEDLAAVSGQVTDKIREGTAPVLATVFSDAFKVFSAKRFPGVVESTALSRHFATQGIKIPIRKDNKDSKKKEHGDLGDLDDDDDGDDY